VREGPRLKPGSSASSSTRFISVTRTSATRRSIREGLVRWKLAGRIRAGRLSRVYVESEPAPLSRFGGTIFLRNLHVMKSRKASRLQWSLEGKSTSHRVRPIYYIVEPYQLISQRPGCNRCPEVAVRRRRRCGPPQRKQRCQRPPDSLERWYSWPA
jgi:hypothetical protein